MSAPAPKKPSLPHVDKPSFTIGSLNHEGLEERYFDPCTTACYLHDWQVDELCAQFFGWRYDLRKEIYTNDAGQERTWYWEAWLNPKGKGTYHYGLESVKPPAFRTRKWGEVLTFCLEQGWQPEIIERVDERDGKTKYALKLAGVEGLTSYPATPHKGDAICRSFLAAAWTLQEEAEATQTQDESTPQPTTTESNQP